MSASALLAGGLPASGTLKAQVDSSDRAVDTVGVERRAPFMGTVLAIRVEGPTRTRGIRAIEEAFGAVREMEGLLSTWRSDSELSELNRIPVGERTRVSPALAPILEKVWQWSRLTDGAFRPQVGALVDVWGLRSGGSLPSPEDLKRARQASRLGAFRLLDGAEPSGEGSIDSDARAVLRTDSLAWIDAGGFGKGAALDAAALRLRRAGIDSAVLDFGGQLLVMGPGERPVGVAHPEMREESVVTLTIHGSTSVATAGSSERRWSVDGRIVTHIMDPDSGFPAEPWGSVTVVSEDPLAADVLSTALFVMGPDRAREWARDRRDVGVLVLEIEAGGTGPEVESNGGHPGLSVDWNRAMEPYFHRNEIIRSQIIDPERGERRH